MKIYHVAVSKNQRVPSGGETCMVALIQYLKSRRCQNVILTTPIGKQEFEKAGLREDGNFVVYKVNTLTKKQSTYHIFISWIYSTFYAFGCVRDIEFDQNDIIVCHSYFFPDYLTSYFCLMKNIHMKAYYWYHMVEPKLWYGYEGEFTHTVQLPSVIMLFYHLNQLMLKYILRKKDVIFTVNDYFKTRLEKMFPRNKVYSLKHFGGVDVTDISSKKNYDIIWVGRFHPQKGIGQFLDIIDRIHTRIKHVRVVVIGGGDSALETMFKREVRVRGLESNVSFLGPVTNKKQYYQYLSQSKILIMTSTYEGFGLVNLEAMRQRLAVVAYDLEVYKKLKKGMILVPLLNNALFADTVVKLLINKRYYRKQIKKSYIHSLQFSWESMGKEVYNILL